MNISFVVSMLMSEFCVKWIPTLKLEVQAPIYIASCTANQDFL